MRDTNKNIAAAIIISAFFFVPVFCSAQVAGGSDYIDPSTTVINPPVNDTNVDEESSSQSEVIILSIGGLACPFVPGGTVLSAAMSALGQLRNSISG